MNTTTATPEAHTELRDQIGQALNDAIASGAPQADYCDSREIDYLADAALAVVLPLLADRDQRLATAESASAVYRKLLAAYERGETPPADPKAPYYIDQAWLDAAPVENAAGADPADLECQVPPFGWRCTRGAGHEGPCAAVECPEDVAAVAAGMARLAAAETCEPDHWIMTTPEAGNKVIIYDRTEAERFSSIDGRSVQPFYAQRPASAAPDDPMDWPLPCDVTVGCGTHKKGVALRSLVARMEVLHSMAQPTSAADSEDAALTIALDALNRSEPMFSRQFSPGERKKQHVEAMDKVRAALAARTKKDAS